MKSVSTVPFAGTKEQEKELCEWLAEHKDVPGITMQALQHAQDIYGYLPIEVQIMLAQGLDVPLEEVYGIATFYSQFRLEPVGEYKISVCLGTACYVKGSNKVYDTLKDALELESGGITPDGKFSLESCRCIGACGLAPVMMINSDVYGKLTGSAKEIDDILSKYR